MRTLVLALAASTLVMGCKNAGNEVDTVALEWSQGDSWYLATSYRIANTKTDGAIAGDIEGNSDTSFGEHWSEDVVWSYQVIEQGLVPTSDDELYDFAIKADGTVGSLAVIRAYIDGSLNDDVAMLEADPVVYLVFREDRDRLAGLVSFLNVDGDRTQRAFSSKDLGKSWSTLSQSNLSMAPTYLAPFGFSKEAGEKMTENGSWMATEPTDNGVDVVFNDEMGGGTVATRYEDGEPWPTWTSSENVDSRMLSTDEVAKLRTHRPWLAEEPPEDYNYRAALSSSTDLDATMTLSAEDIADGGWAARTPSGYTPWAGAWWPLKTSELVFGHRSAETLSDQIQEDIDPFKAALKELRDALEGLEGEEQAAKTAEYHEKNQEMIAVLVEFYDGIRDDLDGGIITVADGKMAHTVDGWEYEINDLSTMDKFALHTYLEGTSTSNPFYLPAQEILSSYKPGGGDWWGHCNGWAAAAILTDEPRESVTATTTDGTEITYSTGDIKGLLTEAHYSTYSRFYGGRYYKEGDDIADLHPPAFHKLITFYHRQQQVGMVFDTTASEAVWNFPSYQSVVTIDETTAGAPTTNINIARASELELLHGIGPELANAIVEYRETNGPFQAVEDITNVHGIGNGTLNGIIDDISIDAFQRSFDVTAKVSFATDGVDEEHVDTNPDSPKGFVKEYNYTLTTDANGTITGGEWEDDNKHPDFAWVPYHNPDTSRSGGENTFLNYANVQDLVVNLDRR
jgi:competence ComEA-like helix-hairpin-helix protein